MKRYRSCHYIVNIILIFIFFACSTCSRSNMKYPESQDDNKLLDFTVDNNSIINDYIEQAISKQNEVIEENIEDIKISSTNNINLEIVNNNLTAILYIPDSYVYLPIGIFLMGNYEGEYDEAPVHQVKVNAFYMGKYEVNQKEYSGVMGNNPSSFKGDNLPVENVSWFNAVEYCNRLSLKEGLELAYQGEGDDIVCDFSKSGYRLPTEAEWEYAAGGKNRLKYAGSNFATVIGWYINNSNGRTNEVGIKDPNANDLYDMSGNVAEWCWDWHGAYSGNNQLNNSMEFYTNARIVRGGSWRSSENELRVTARNYHAPTVRSSSVGFRVVRTIK